MYQCIEYMLFFNLWYMQSYNVVAQQAPSYYDLNNTEPAAEPQNEEHRGGVTSTNVEMVLPMCMIAHQFA